MANLKADSDSMNKKRDGMEGHVPVSNVEFIIHTYPDLHPFLESTVHLLEDLYEH